MSDARAPSSPSTAVLSLRDTIVPRHVAAIVDTLCAIILGFICAKAVSNNHPVLQGMVVAVVYLAYFLLFEGSICRTPGKLIAGLAVVGIDGRRCTWRQAWIRTGFRILEVNPALLGAIPAAICIVTSRNRQRLGDRVARTTTVRASVLKSLGE